MARTTLTTAAVEKLRPAAERREIADISGVRLVIQPSGAKSWAMRFRRPNGKHAKLTLGPVDLTDRKPPIDEKTKKPIIIPPKIGEPLNLSEARVLAANINRQRASDLDVIADFKSDKRRRRDDVKDREAKVFSLAARDFIDRHARPNTRRWNETARILGLDYSTDGQPTTIKGGLCERWADKPIANIDGDDIYTIVDEAIHDGIPGLEQRNEGPSDARGRKMADVLGTMFKWLHQKRRIKVNPSLGSHRPKAPVARERVLNVKTDVRNADELRWFWAACRKIGETDKDKRENGQPFAALFKVLLLTGCRLNEIARATGAELSDDSATLRLPGNRTKNKLPHNVPLSPLAREVLAGVPRMPNSKFLFSTNGKTPVSGFSKLKARLDRAMLVEARKETKIATVAPWRLHDLRRTCATGMAGIGIAPHIIEACLNHVSGAKSGVAGTYNVEMYEPEKRAALERWANHIEALVAGRKADVRSLDAAREKKAKAKRGRRRWSSRRPPM
jgi:integrase